MSTPGEHKTVQTRILAYAQEIGWSFVPREEAEQRRGFEPPSPSGVTFGKLRTFEGRDAKGGRSKNDEPNTREPKSGD